MPIATVVERVGWSGSPSLSWAKDAEIRPKYKISDPTDRLVHLPMLQIQSAPWFPDEDLPLGNYQIGAPPVSVMTSAFSRFIQARMLPSRTTPDLLGGTWSLLQEAESVPARLT
jgi:hypothetical protein